MDLTVTLLSGEFCRVNLSAAATVGDLRGEVAKSFDVTPSRVRLFMDNGQRVTFEDKQKTLSSYRLSSDSKIMARILSPLQVFVMNEKGERKTYDVTEEETVDELQRKIYNKEQTAIDQQRLTFSGKQLETGKKLKEYNIANGSIINTTLRLRGG
ncbi:uncharacterized protein [Hoplias malabaricus]|uniref:uncharacterized protein n=1 Tax=Hoplias malabaricus TaxID=27720 RepID=UPI0034632547